MANMFPAMAGDTYHLAPSPNRTIGCQDLLKEGACAHSGWLRRQSIRNRFKIFAWPQVYVVISGGCVYCYSNELGKRPASAFSLYGYDKVFRAGEVAEKEATWTFKLVHVNPDYRSYLFSASSEKEMAFWMSLCHREMLRANGRLPRTQGDGTSFDVGLYQEAGSDACGPVTSQDYMAMEASIYEDSSMCLLPSNYTNKRADDDSDEEMDRVVITRPDLQQRPPQAPPVPQRPPKALPGVKAKQQAEAVVIQGLKELQMAGRSQQSPVSSASVNTTKDTDRQREDKSSKLMRKRGSPDGSSLKKDDKPTEAEDFWSTIFFYGGKEKAGEIIRQMPDDGVYLVRVNEDGSMVLHVYAEDVARKFQVFEVGQKFTLKKDSGDHFSRVEELIYFYYTHPLPKLETYLSECYVSHPNYHTLHFS